MTIRLLTTLCGPHGNLHPGEHTLAPEQEKALVDAGFASFVKREAKAETARRPRGETAALQHVARVDRR